MIECFQQNVRAVSEFYELNICIELETWIVHGLSFKFLRSKDDGLCEGAKD